MTAESARHPKHFLVGEIAGVVVRDLLRFNDDRGWLAELFRHDELEEEYYPAMTYLSATLPGVTRGPHEHVDQADLFCFLGPSNFEIRLWDNRPHSSTFGYLMTMTLGADNPKSLLVPRGVVHAYRNVGAVTGIVINCPNRLYAGAHKNEPVDEIRHEDEPDTIFRMD